MTYERHNIDLSIVHSTSLKSRVSEKGMLLRGHSRTLNSIHACRPLSVALLLTPITS